MHIIKWKKKYLKGLRPVWLQLCDILEKAELWRQWQDEWWPRVGEGTDEEEETEDIWGSENPMCDINDGSVSLYICPNP